MAFKWLIPQCVEFDEKDIKKIVDVSIKIFQEVSWTIDGTEEFMQLLKNFGCEIDKKKVKFTNRVVDITLDHIKKTKRKNIKEKISNIAPKEITYSTSGQALWCCDVETDKLRPATKKDLEDFSRVVNSFEGLGRTHPTFIPTDAPLKTRELHAYITIMLNSDKPYRVSCYSPEILDYFIEANAIYYGSREEGINNLLLPAKVWVNTPFMISRESIESAMKLRKFTKKPLVYTAMPVCGVATPVSYDGALTLITAEVLGINAISLAIDGVLSGWPSCPLSFDMKNAVHNQWGPETVTIFTGCQQVASYVFGSSPLGAWATTSVSAKVPGAQSMMERSFGLGMAFLAGIRDFGGLATLSFADVGSVVELMLDMEIISSLKEFVKGFEVTDETIAEELIKEVACKGANFLETEHTVKYFRKFQWFPELMDRRVPGTWNKNPITMLEKARKKATDLIRTAPNKCPIDENKKRELLQLIQQADNELGK